MADRIKGITVEIGGDTTKLSDALKNVNKYIRETQDQLLDVNKLLKLDPGNADLLLQKQKYLSEAISDTTEVKAFPFDQPLLPIFEKIGLKKGLILCYPQS
ncbi:hypothetical protein [Lactobacillus delbrueckii]|jgi:phage-related minor tail protein|uniref:hypothetical protein n=1 Tax=Lactobacillus delbrueckii TaxID=1584 RepID=UPI0022229DE9|nr:hypothetical protein [Lactobacillus delbrueckii]UYX13680.1 hypothetical protein OJ966_04880 [Lactobacillus delbrueckii]